MRLTVCDGPALDRVAPSKAMGHLHYLNTFLDFLTPSVGTRTGTQDKSKWKVIFQIIEMLIYASFKWISRH